MCKRLLYVSTLSVLVLAVISCGIKGEPLIPAVETYLEE